MKVAYKCSTKFQILHCCEHFLEIIENWVFVDCISLPRVQKTDTTDDSHIFSENPTYMAHQITSKSFRHTKAIFYFQFPFSTFYQTTCHWKFKRQLKSIFCENNTCHSYQAEMCTPLYQCHLSLIKITTKKKKLMKAKPAIAQACVLFLICSFAELFAILTKEGATQRIL